MVFVFLVLSMVSCDPELLALGEVVAILDNYDDSQTDPIDSIGPSINIPNSDSLQDVSEQEDDVIDDDTINEDKDKDEDIDQNDTVDDDFTSGLGEGLIDPTEDVDLGNDVDTDTEVTAEENDIGIYDVNEDYYVTDVVDNGDELDDSDFADGYVDDPIVSDDYVTDGSGLPEERVDSLTDEDGGILENEDDEEEEVEEDFIPREGKWDYLTLSLVSTECSDFINLVDNYIDIPTNASNATTIRIESPTATKFTLDIDDLGAQTSCDLYDDYGYGCNTLSGDVYSSTAGTISLKWQTSGIYLNSEYMSGTYKVEIDCSGVSCSFIGSFPCDNTIKFTAAHENH